MAGIQELLTFLLAVMLMIFLTIFFTYIGEIYGPDPTPCMLGLEHKTTIDWISCVTPNIFMGVITCGAFGTLIAALCFIVVAPAILIAGAITGYRFPEERKNDEAEKTREQKESEQAPRYKLQVVRRKASLGQNSEGHHGVGVEELGSLKRDSVKS